MNPVHAMVLKQIRADLAASDSKAAASLQELSDDQLIRMMFSNYRGTSQRGMRLTRLGLELMLGCFQAFDIKLTPARQQINSQEILYLDRKARLPYYLSLERIVLFESALGMMVKLADGDLSTLIGMEP